MAQPRITGAGFDPESGGFAEIYIDGELVPKRTLEAAPAMLKALQECLQLIDDMMPGVAYITLPDYSRLNMVPINAQAAVTRATLVDTIEETF